MDGASDTRVAGEAGAHVRLRGVGKSFGAGPAAVEGFDLEVQGGSFVSLIGPSGCGKSTLLRLIAALSVPSAGEIQIDGRTPERGQPGVAFIFQDATLLPWLSVQHNIEMPLRIRGMARADRARLADTMLRLVRLEHVRNHFPRELSGGMKMRVSVARALAQSPRLLLMDEPFGALDEMTRHHLNEELLEMRASDRWTAFFVTHSVAEAVFLSDRVLVMAGRPGRVIADVPVAFGIERGPELRERPEFHQVVDHVSQLLRAGGKGVGS